MGACSGKKKGKEEPPKHATEAANVAVTPNTKGACNMKREINT